MKMLYDFKNGHTDQYFRDRLGKKPVPVVSKFKVIKDKDLEEIIKNKTAVINETEAYVIDANGNHYDVFYYKSPFGFSNGNPKFHITKCEAVKTHGGYRVSNSSKVDVKHIRTHEIHEGLVLELCGYCRNAVLSTNITTEEFFEEQKKMYIERILERQPIPTDFDGYTHDWSFISKKYRESKNYTCEECGVDLGDNKSYCDTHHLDGEKTHNTEDNLKCLCVLCHAHQNEQHIKNFKKRKMRKRVESFVDDFKDVLVEKGNKYVSEYIRNKKD